MYISITTLALNFRVKKDETDVQWHIRVGANKLNGDQYVIILVKIHEKFVTAKSGYDIALAKTKDEIIYSKLVQPIPLPDRDPIYLKSYPLVLSGWGAITVSIIINSTKKETIMI